MIDTNLATTIRSFFYRDRLFTYMTIFALLSSLLFPSLAFTGDFRVTPIRLILDKDARSGVINIVNEGQEALQVQLKAVEWIQDEEGKDKYIETKDVIFFPKIMKIQPTETRIVRTGIKILRPDREKTYRLFIEEIPGPKKENAGATIQVAFRFGVPIFVKPFEEEISAKLESLTLSKGTLNVKIKNTGNSHFTINTVVVKGLTSEGGEVFSRELTGWYLLNGVTRSYTLFISQEDCEGLAQIQVEVKTDPLSLNGKMDVTKSMCQP